MLIYAHAWDLVDLNLFLKAHVHPSDFARFFVLFCNGPFVECSLLIGYYFASDNFQLREIAAMHSG